MYRLQLERLGSGFYFEGAVKGCGVSKGNRCSSCDTTTISTKRDRSLSRCLIITLTSKHSVRYKKGALFALEWLRLGGFTRWIHRSRDLERSGRFPSRTASSHVERALDRPAEVEGECRSRDRERGGFVVAMDGLSRLSFERSKLRFGGCGPSLRAKIAPNAIGGRREFRVWAGHQMPRLNRAAPVPNPVNPQSKSTECTTATHSGFTLRRGHMYWMGHGQGAPSSRRARGEGGAVWGKSRGAAGRAVQAVGCGVESQRGR